MSILLLNNFKQRWNDAKKILTDKYYDTDDLDSTNGIKEINIRIREIKDNLKLLKLDQKQRNLLVEMFQDLEYKKRIILMSNLHLPSFNIRDFNYIRTSEENFRNINTILNEINTILKTISNTNDIQKLSEYFKDIQIINNYNELVNEINNSIELYISTISNITLFNNIFSRDHFNILYKDYPYFTKILNHRNDTFKMKIDDKYDTFDGIKRNLFENDIPNNLKKIKNHPLYLIKEIDPNNKELITGNNFNNLVQAFNKYSMHIQYKSSSYINLYKFGSTWNTCHEYFEYIDGRNAIDIFYKICDYIIDTIIPYIFSTNENNNVVSDLVNIIDTYERDFFKFSTCKEKNMGRHSIDHYTRKTNKILINNKYLKYKSKYLNLKNN